MPTYLEEIYLERYLEDPFEYSCDSDWGDYDNDPDWDSEWDEEDIEE